MTTACNAYVQPIMAHYLKALNQALVKNGFDCPLFLITSGGGMITLDSAIRVPVRLVESGPNGGAVLASHIAASCIRVLYGVVTKAGVTAGGDPNLMMLLAAVG